MLPGLRPPPTPRNPSTLKHSFPPDQVVSPLSCTTISPQTRLALLSEEPTDSEISSNGKPAAYPEGPVCVYDPGVYLYLEPTQEEASEFDVILNVAKEVLNPFEMSEGVQAANSPIHAEGSAFAGSSAVGSPPTQEEHLRRQPQSVFSFDRNSPLPIDSPSQKPTRPEYVHIPWDHHTAIVTDLLRLVQLIDERVNRGKRVLIHCQCGVSRSASLIIAYGLYKSPDLSVTEAYDAVKKRSQWIGPNMNLIYQLNEFKSLLLKMGMGQSALRSWKSGSGSRGLTSGGRSSTFSHSQTSGGRAAVLQDGLRDPEPLTAPLPDQKERPSSMVESRKTPVSLAISVPRLLPSPSGTPSSAPPGMSWMPFSSDPVSTREETVPLHAPATNDPPASTPTPSEDDLPLLLPSVYTPGARTTRFPSIPRSTPADYQPSKPPPAAAPQLSRYYAEIAMIPPSPPPHPVHPARSLPPFPAPPPIPFSSSTSSTDTGTGIPRPRISVIRPSRSFVLNRRLHLKASNPSLNTALARGASPPLPSLANTAAAAAAAQSAGSLPLALPPVHPDSSPSILSPREATFQGLPWSSAAIGSTTSGMNDVHGSGDTAAAAADGGDPEDAMAARRRMLAHAASNFVPLVADPRSPAQEGGESIRRSIFDVL